MSEWRQISTADDFPNLSVYTTGRNYRIMFDNLEYVEKWAFWLRAAGFFTLLLGSFIMPFVLKFQFDEGSYFNENSYMAFPILFIGSWVYYFFFMYETKRVTRRIELDFDDDELRILKGDEEMGSRKLSRLAELSVEPHPDTEWELEDRRAKNLKVPGELGKQHCLFGWFGVGGAEKVILIQRAEWPSRNSLYEVQQAMDWAWKLGMSGEVEESDAPETSGGMKPPLD